MKRFSITLVSLMLITFFAVLFVPSVGDTLEASLLRLLARGPRGLFYGVSD